MWNRLAVGVCMALPLAALLSMNCGVVAFPVEVPRLVAANAKTISFTTDIVDEDGVALDGVNVRITGYAMVPDVLFVETDQTKPEAPRVVDKKLSYSKFGNHAVIVNYSKEGYQGVTVGYSPLEEVRIRSWTYEQYKRVNTLKEPTTRIVLRKKV